MEIIPGGDIYDIVSRGYSDEILERLKDLRSNREARRMVNLMQREDLYKPPLQDMVQAVMERRNGHDRKKIT